MTDERVKEANEWMKTVNCISSKTVDLQVEGDPLTIYDSNYYSVVEYTDGRVIETLSQKGAQPSVRLHKINSIMESWGLTLKNSPKKKHNILDCSFTWDGLLYVSMTINSFHQTLFKFNSFNTSDIKVPLKIVGEWFEYDENNIEKIIDYVIFQMGEKSPNTGISREIKLRKILK